MLEPLGAIVVLPIASVSVVVDAARIADVEDAELVCGERRDLAAHLGLASCGAQPFDEARRRAVRLASDGSWLIAGERVEVRRVGPEAFRPLPVWLESLRERLAIVSLVRLESRFGFRLDVDRLAGPGGLRTARDALGHGEGAGL